MIKTSSAVLFTVGVLFLFGVVQLSNHRLLWAGIIHLILFNAAIGIGEGMLLRAKYRVRRKTALRFMIASNYFAMSIGGLGIVWLIRNYVPFNLYSAWKLVPVSYLAVFIITALFKFPFVLRCMRRRSRRVSRALKVSFSFHAPTYIFLIIWYAAASDISVYMEASLDQTLTFVSHIPGFCYFISAEDGDIHRRNIDGSALHNVAPLNSSDRDDRLIVRSDSTAHGILYAIKHQERDGIIEIPIISNFTLSRTVLRTERLPRSTPKQIIDLRDVSDRELKYHIHQERYKGLEITFPFDFLGFEGGPKLNAEKIRLSLHTPFASWRVSNVTVLPGNQAVFQFGRQICVFDPASRRLGLIAKGQGPLVMIVRSSS